MTGDQLESFRERLNRQIGAEMMQGVVALADTLSACRPSMSRGSICLLSLEISGHLEAAGWRISRMPDQ